VKHVEIILSSCSFLVSLNFIFLFPAKIAVLPVQIESKGHWSFRNCWVAALKVFVSCKNIMSSLYDFKSVNVLVRLSKLFKPLTFNVAILIE
jgi:hypothetical protein